MRRYGAIEFQQLGDPAWQLIVAEAEKEIPFDIRRIFYMYGTQRDIVRGKHANRRSRFVLISVKGSVRVKADDGKFQEEFLLDAPWKGVYLDKMVWKTMEDFSEDAVLLVLSSEKFDPQEYIRDYQEFLQEVSEP